MIPPLWLNQLVADYGYVAVAVSIAVESMGIPVPGETILILAAIYAAANSGLDIYLVATAAAIGAIVGDNLGYWLGSHYGYPLLQRYGRHIGLTAPRVRLGQYLFQRYGAFIVFFGRFVALLRILAAFLAGANHMDRRLFFIANAAGGIVWAIVFAYGGYYFGKAVFELHGSLAPVILGAAAVLFFGSGILLRRLVKRLKVLADLERPGPLSHPMRS